MLTLVSESSENPHGSERFEGFEISGMHWKLEIFGMLWPLRNLLKLRNALETPKSPKSPKANLTNSSDYSMKPRPFIGFYRTL